MQRRVIELVSGQIVRDERGGGYQTQSITVPVATVPRDRTAATAAPTASAPVPTATATADTAPTPIIDDADRDDVPISVGARGAASFDPDNPPPLNEPGRRA